MWQLEKRQSLAQRLSELGESMGDKQADRALSLVLHGNGLHAPHLRLLASAGHASVEERQKSQHQGRAELQGDESGCVRRALTNRMLRRGQMSINEWQTATVRCPSSFSHSFCIHHHAGMFMFARKPPTMAHLI